MGAEDNLWEAVFLHHMVQGSNPGSQALVGVCLPTNACHWPHLCVTSSLKATNVVHIGESLPKAFCPLLQELKSHPTAEEANSWLLQVPCCCVHRDHRC